MDAAATGSDGGSVAITTEVAIDSGPLHGTAAGDLVIFKGVPYAGAPRWMPPTTPIAWTAALDATAFGPACPQNKHPELPQAEQCLSLNVWAHADGKPRPVIVWIHGGGYIEGSSRDPSYDGAQLADNADVDVVSINYRLGILGFLALPQLTAPDGGIGNYGLRDQIAALGWVKRNINAFGGDPTHVMISGESAGGAAVCTLLAAPGAQGLYSAAAIESGPCQVPLELTQPVGSFPAAEGFGVVVVAAPLGCTSGDVAGCLRGKSAAQILALDVPVFYDVGLPITPTFPVIDGVVMDKRPFEALAAGRGNVPVIVGSNLEDASVFVFQMGITNAAGQLDAYLHAIGQDSNKTQLEAIYPVTTFGEFFAATAYMTEVAFACSALGVAIAHQSAPTYLYELQRGIPNGMLAPLRSVHGYDYINLFGTFASFLITPEAADLSVSAQIQKAWGELAHGIAPVGFPAASGSTPSFRQIDETSTNGTSWRGGRCSQLQALGILHL